MRKKQMSIAVIVLIFTIINIVIASGLGILAFRKDAEYYADFKRIPSPENGFVCTESDPFNGVLRVEGLRREFLRDSITYTYDNKGVIEYDVELYYEKNTAPKEIVKDVSQVMKNIETVEEDLLIELIARAMTSDSLVGEKEHFDSGALVTIKYAAALGLEKGDRCIRIEAEYSR